MILAERLECLINYLKMDYVARNIRTIDLEKGIIVFDTLNEEVWEMPIDIALEKMDEWVIFNRLIHEGDFDPADGKNIEEDF